MTVEELRIVRDKLERLNVELNQFKDELLTLRTAELEQSMHTSTRRALLSQKLFFDTSK
jgi:hypothetical protein